MSEGAWGLWRWLEVSPYEKAAIIVENSLHGRPPAAISDASLAARRLYHAPFYRVGYTIVAVACMALAFWEPPVEGTRAELPVLRGVNAICLVVFLCDSVLQYVYFGPALFYSKR
jgi:hypothetical protein